MGPILPLHSLVIHEAYVGFIDQGGCLEAVAVALKSHVAVREAVEPRIDHWRQLAEGKLFPVAPSAEELTDVVQSHPLGSVLAHGHWIVSPERIARTLRRSRLCGTFCPNPSRHRRFRTVQQPSEIIDRLAMETESGQIVEAFDRRSWIKSSAPQRVGRRHAFANTYIRASAEM